MWTLWALLLIVHGALSRWVQAAPSRPVAATSSDVLLITIGVLTVNQLEGLTILDALRVGLFFVAFGFSGRQLMGSLLLRR